MQLSRTKKGIMLQRIGWILLITSQWTWQHVQGQNGIRCNVDDYGSFIVDPKACEKFYYCDNHGIPTSVYCPDGMWFNPTKRICDLPSNVRCEVETTAIPSIDEETVECPRRDSTAVTFVSSKVNCRRYYLCYHGRPFQQDCIPKLHWNPKKKRCDIPAKARCSLEPPQPTCSSRGMQLIPHPSECDYFYYCINGFASLQQCPFYHHWDVETQSCKWQNRARCIVNVTAKSSAKAKRKRKT